jgi:hypothetical protein
MTDRTERFPAEWLSQLLERGSNFELIRPEPALPPRPLPAYVSDGERVVRVRCSAQTSPFSRARLVDYRVQERVA